jgi:UDP-N-acetylglucosamine 1-carboxyvinyltransferase
MDKMIVTGNGPLHGSVAASGAKNAALPILFSSLLATGRHTFRNVPRLRDIDSTAELLNSLGCECSWQGDSFIVDVGELKSFEAHYDLVRKMRASFLVMGAIAGSVW